MTNEQMTENMIAWAKDKLGCPDYAGWCPDFIEDALEKSNDMKKDYIFKCKIANRSHYFACRNCGRYADKKKQEKLHN